MELPQHTTTNQDHPVGVPNEIPYTMTDESPFDTPTGWSRHALLRIAYPYAYL